MFELLGVGRKDIGAVHLEALGRLWDGHGNDARISLPHGVTARLAASRLILETLPSPLSRAELVPGCPLVWGGYTVTLLDHRQGEGLALRPGPDWEPVAVAPCDSGERLTLPETHGEPGASSGCAWTGGSRCRSGTGCRPSMWRSALPPYGVWVWILPLHRRGRAPADLFKL